MTTDSKNISPNQDENNTNKKFKAWGHIKEHSDAYIAIFGFAAILTGVWSNVASSSNNAKVLQRMDSANGVQKIALKLQDSAFHVEYRAYLSIDNIDVNIAPFDPVKHTYLVKVDVSIKNVGKTPANDMRYFLQAADLVIQPTPPFHKSNGERMIIYAGQSGTCRYDGLIIDQNLFNEFVSGKRHIYITTTITYKDIFKYEHHINFFGIYDNGNVKPIGDYGDAN